MTTALAHQAAADYQTTDRRNLIAKVHIAKAQLRLDDDVYREALSRVTGKTSAKDMNIAELEAVLKAFSKSGFKAMPSRHSKSTLPTTMKITALWLSGWNLGVIQDPSPRAMEAFIARQTGIAKAQWLINPHDANGVIDGLKAWLAREAKVDWKTHKHMPDHMNMAQYRVIAAQWLALRACGAVSVGRTWTGNETGIDEEVMNYAEAVVKKNVREMTGRDFLAVQTALGKKLRKALEGKS